MGSSGINAIPHLPAPPFPDDVAHAWRPRPHQTAAPTLLQGTVRPRNRTQTSTGRTSRHLLLAAHSRFLLPHTPLCAPPGDCFGDWTHLRVETPHLTHHDGLVIVTSLCGAGSLCLYVILS